MLTTDELRKEVRVAKNNLIKASKILLKHLEEYDDGDEDRTRETTLLSERIEFLQEEIMYDVNNLHQDASMSSSEARLRRALLELKQQLAVEKEIFDQQGDNADRLLDISYRIQEIEAAVQPQGK